MWTVDSEEPGSGGTTSDYRELLSHHFIARGLLPDQTLWLGIHDQIKEHGIAEWRELGEVTLPGLETAKVQKLLGSGYVVTEFLMAAARLGGEMKNRVCAAGALINLALVACDRMLENTASVTEVLPSFEPGLGQTKLPMDVLMEAYRRKIADLEIGKDLLLMVNKSIRLTLEAEAQTVYLNIELPFRFWLRKGAIPFVLMGLPACSGRSYLTWLYRLGRFFSAVDDVVDYALDMQKNEPNLLRSYTEEARFQFIGRLAEWGAQILSEWDRLVPRTNEFAGAREIFLYFVWNWLGTAPFASSQR